MENTKDLRLAVLIDADNIPYRLISGILEEVAKYGSPTFKRIYGDWTRPTVSGWMENGFIRSCHHPGAAI